MLKTVEGVYENGQFKLVEPLPGIVDARVVMTVLPANWTACLPMRMRWEYASKPSRGVT